MRNQYGCHGQSHARTNVESTKECMEKHIEHISYLLKMKLYHDYSKDLEVIKNSCYNTVECFLLVFGNYFWHKTYF